MNLKYWREVSGTTTGKEILISSNTNKYDIREGIIEIKKLDTGLVRIRENCDQYYGMEVTKQEAIELLQEAITWLEEI